MATAALPKLEAGSMTSELEGIMRLFDSFGSNIFGKTAKTTQQNSMDPGVTQAIQSLMGSMQTAGDSGTMDQVIADIFTKAKVEFAPNVFNTKAAGAYNSTALQQMKDKAVADATNASAKTKLDAQNTNFNTQAGLLAALSRATGTTTQTQKTGGGPAGMVSPLMMGGLSLYKKLAGADAKKKPGQQTTLPDVPAVEYPQNGTLPDIPTVDDLAGSAMRNGLRSIADSQLAGTQAMWEAGAAEGVGAFDAAGSLGTGLESFSLASDFASGIGALTAGSELAGWGATGAFDIAGSAGLGEAGAALGLGSELGLDFLLPGLGIGLALLSGGGDGCYITSALDEFRGPEANAKTLATLRDFRDNFMGRSGMLKEMLAQYYLEAPGILLRLQALPEEQRLPIFEGICMLVDKAAAAWEKRDGLATLGIYETMFKAVKYLAGTEVSNG